MFFKSLLSPKYVYDFLGALLPWLIVFTTLLLAYGLVGGLIFAPADYQQGDGFRIIYIHVPSAFLSLMIYAGMCVAAFMSLVWKIKLGDLAIKAATAIGLSFTFIALVTGSLWGKPMWGTWWVWDARLTSELILGFIYLAIMALDSALQGKRSQATLRNIFVLIGGLNLPIIHFSVYWWNTLHQGATLTLLGPSHIASAMRWPLLAMIAGCVGLAGLVWIMRMRNLILWDARKSQWVQLMLYKK